MVATATKIDDLCWTSTRFSAVFNLDRQLVAQALEAAPSMSINGQRVWHIRDAAPAIYKRVLGLSDEKNQLNPDKLHPKDRLDHYRAEREKIKFKQETREVILAAEVEREIGEAFKLLAQSLDSLRDTLEISCGLLPEAVSIVEHTIDSARDQIYASILQLTAREE